MKILLLGNPNVGKSVVFNRLTGVNVIAANYPGTTVTVTRGRMRLAGNPAEVIDVPGTYVLDPTSRAEKVAANLLNEMADDDIIINVIDATNLERSLNLTLQLAKLRKRMIVALNFWDETRHTGVKIDVAKLEARLGVPCMPLVAITGVGVKKLVERLPDAGLSTCEFDDEERWHETGRIVEAVQRVTHRHHSFLDRLADASVRPVSGSLIALLVLFVMFEVIRFIGEGLITWVFDPIFEKLWAPLMLVVSGWIGGRGVVHDIVIGKLVDGQIDFGESFGMLTTGLYVPFAAVLPYVFAFYLVLSFLEDSGYLPRLAILSDALMHKVGLHGMGIIPMLLGLGCNVPGAMSGRIMESRRERFIATTLMAICVPCAAQAAMIMGLAGEHGAKALLPIFGTLFIVWIVLGMVLNRVIKGESPEILMDVPPYRIPYFKGLCKKVMMRIVWFLKDAIPWVLVGVLLVNVLYTLGVLTFIGKATGPVVTGILGLPPEAAGGLVIGFLRKDVAVGMLAPLNLNLRQIIVASVVLAMYFPCVAAFAVIAKELGTRDMLKSAALMLGSALLVGGLLNVLLTLMLGY